MDDFDSTRDNVSRISNELNELLNSAKSVSGMSDQPLENWEKICLNVQSQISGEMLHLAVVGPIKSGKSTFVNSLLMGDHLKRGAGVITSIVTRIRRGSILKATLFFKSWDDVNAEIEQAMTLFPSGEWRSETGPFDIRRKKDRTDLAAVLEKMSPDMLMEGGTLNANAILLANYVKGYDAVKNEVNSENRQVEYIGDDLDAHQVFVANDALSVYLKDIQLEIESDILNRGIEIADCQGSDSPNPLHLAMIQDYLVLAHLIIYVVSSRTGLRQADIRFLSIIKKMGILDNILFVVNCDFSEHESLSELNALVEKVKHEISIIKPDPRLFTFSSLLGLFENMGSRLSPKDRDRLAQWRGMKELSESTVRERERFLSTLQLLIDEKRGALLFQNHLERLRVIAEGISHWVDIHRNVLSGDVDHAHQVIEKIARHDEKITHIKNLIKDTLDGGGQKLMNELKRDVDKFFSPKSDGILDSVLRDIRNYRVTVEDYGETLEKSGFNNTLYLIFQDFKQKIDGFMAENVTPRIIHYIKEKEDRIGIFLESLYTPYEAMVVEALEEYNHSVEKIGISPVFVDIGGAKAVNMSSVKQVLGIKLPSAESGLRYSARIKTDATIRLGIYSAVKLIKKIFKKPIADQREDAFMALKDGINRMKREMEKAMLFHFKNYQENIKFQYVLKLVEGTSNFIYEELNSRFQAYLTDLSRLAALIDEKGMVTEETSKSLSDMNEAARRITQRIDQTGRVIHEVISGNR
jgi:hypothetical protein